MADYFPMHPNFISSDSIIILLYNTHNYTVKYAQKITYYYDNGDANFYTKINKINREPEWRGTNWVDTDSYMAIYI